MHTSVYGITLSGKSHYAKDRAAAAGKRGVKCVALDPLDTEWPDNVTVCTDWDAEFFEALRELSEEHGGGYVFVDEADIFLSQSNRQNWWIVTRGRHYGFKVFVISQRPALVAPTVRTQCADVIMYRLSRNDARVIADEVADDRIAVHVPNMNQGTLARAYWGRNRERALDIVDYWSPVKENNSEKDVDTPNKEE